MQSIYKGFYISALVFLNLLNKLEIKIRCDTLPGNLSVSAIAFNKLNNARLSLA